MDLFCLYTSIGAGIWVAILALLGFYIGNNVERLDDMLHSISISLLLLCGAIIIIYVFRYKAKNKRGE